MTESVTADYLVIGAGAVGMAFADSILNETNATIVIVDRRHRPGGHWNDAYPFVRLHQPSAFYGLNSRGLGSGAIDQTGPNKGYYELASGQEVVSYFDLAMQEAFLPSGRVRFFPMSDADIDGTITSRLSGATVKVEARKTVDATHSQMEIPATHVRPYRVADGVACIPPNDLPRVSAPHSAYVIIGAGKTGMDACLWLLDNGADPESICWIMPRDAWLLNRASYQPGMEFFATASKSIADQLESIAGAETIDDVFERLEAFGEIRRIDPSIRPDAYHCAIVSDDELAQLRRIKNIVRMGRIEQIELGKIVLEQGSISTSPDALHVDCSAAGIPSVPTLKVFDGDRITLQWVRLCQPTLSASFVGFVESTFDDEEVKNRLCRPMVPPTVPVDWLRMMVVQLANQIEWGKHPQVAEWQAKSRLDPFASRIKSLTGTETDVLSELGRYRRYAGPAAASLQRMLAPTA